MTGSAAPRRHALAGPVVAASLAFALAVTAAPPAQADQTYYVPVSRTWVVVGHGYGHGHGLSQYGAQGAALRGRSYSDIAKFYYPGTSWSRVKGKVRVLLSAGSTSDLQVRARQGLTVRDLSHDAVWKLPRRGGLDRWRLTAAKGGGTAVQYHNAKGWHRWDIPGRRHTLRGGGQLHAPGPLNLLVPSGSGVVSRQYRGALRLVRSHAGSAQRDTVNVLRMDQYVRGVVPYEMPTSWEPQALRAQSVAARTYAAWQRAQNPKRSYQICDTTACQVYGGVTAEQPSSNAAVRATSRRILTYRHRPAFTQFSASSGGWTSDGGEPYLPAKKDPYDGFAGNSVHSWSTRVSVSALESSHPNIGRLLDLRVTRRNGHGAWRGRVQRLVLDGSSGRAAMTGEDLRWAFGLRSDWFTIKATPIISRWKRLGAAKSRLGAVRSAEHAVHGGAAQDFRHGRIYWMRSTGARDLMGPVLKAYRTYGGPSSRVGWPTTGMMRAAHSGHKARFQHGMVYSRPRPGAHIVYGAILRRWGQAGAATSALGYPTTNVRRIPGGLRGRFQHGAIRWNRSSGRFTITHFR